jgi:hypothetical protein
MKRLLGLFSCGGANGHGGYASLSPRQQSDLTGGEAPRWAQATAGSPGTGAAVGAQQARQRRASGIACSA